MPAENAVVHRVGNYIVALVNNQSSREMQLRQFSAIGILFADLSLALRGPRCPLYDSVVVGICNYVITMLVHSSTLWIVELMEVRSITIFLAFHTLVCCPC